MTIGAYLRHIRGDYAALIPVKLSLFPRETCSLTWDMDAVIVSTNVSQICTYSHDIQVIATSSLTLWSQFYLISF